MGFPGVILAQDAENSAVELRLLRKWTTWWLGGGTCPYGHVTEHGLYVMRIVFNHSSLYHEFEKETAQFLKRGTLLEAGGSISLERFHMKFLSTIQLKANYHSLRT